MHSRAAGRVLLREGLIHLAALGCNARWGRGSVSVPSTTAPDWELEVFVGNLNEYVFKDVSIDELRFGVKAIHSDGYQSLVFTLCLSPARPARNPGLRDLCQLPRFLLTPGYKSSIF
jgi:hypothetical protein